MIPKPKIVKPYNGHLALRSPQTWTCTQPMQIKIWFADSRAIRLDSIAVIVLIRPMWTGLKYARVHSELQSAGTYHQQPQAQESQKQMKTFKQQVRLDCDGKDDWQR